jgi:hypothetical protein
VQVDGPLEDACHAVGHHCATANAWSP